MKKTAGIRDLIARPGMLVLPGVYDALGARIVEEAGFEAVYISGFCLEASYGLPDMGILTMTEIVSRAASTAAAVGIPLICDADTGYGNAVNVIRTVQEFERAGVAGIHLEDQILPKKCGAFPDKRLVTTGEMVGKIRAAVDARTDPDFLIIARTDAVASGGIEEAVRRGRAYEEAGADAIMVQIPRTVDEIRTACTSFTKPIVLTISESGVQPVLPFAELEQMGLKIAIVPLTLTISAITVMRQVARDIRELESIKPIMERNDSWDSVLQLVGLERVLNWSERYGAQPVGGA